MWAGMLRKIWFNELIQIIFLNDFSSSGQDIVQITLHLCSLRNRILVKRIWNFYTSHISMIRRMGFFYFYTITISTSGSLFPYSKPISSITHHLSICAILRILAPVIMSHLLKWKCGSKYSLPTRSIVFTNLINIK